jgi:tRNA isopentenyl-2-thiomethyl-A-37 hydroxylase MiaE
VGIIYKDTKIKGVKKMKSKKELVHSSTNSHYITGAEDVVAETSFVVPEGKKATLTHTEHETIELKPGKRAIEFVQQYNPATKLVQRIAD